MPHVLTSSKHTHTHTHTHTHSRSLVLNRLKAQNQGRPGARSLLLSLSSGPQQLWLSSSQHLPDTVRCHTCTCDYDPTGRRVSASRSYGAKLDVYW